MELNYMPRSDETRRSRCYVEDYITVYEESDVDQWQRHEPKLCQEFEHPRDATTIMFTSVDAFEKCKNIQSDNDLLKDFWPIIKDDLNGSFNCAYISNDEGEIVKHVSWSCFKLKHAIGSEDPKKELEYEWKQPSVLVHWDPRTGHQLVIFVGLPEHLQMKLRIPSHSDRKRNPYVWHAAFAEQIKHLYNESVWSMRHPVRIAEKARNEKHPPPPDFPKLHDIARHISHVNEILEVAQHTLQSIIQDQISWRVEYAPEKKHPIWIQNQQRLQFAAKELHSFSTRCKSLDDRMKNEINLAFNIVSQRFGRDQQSDSAMMKTIALVSLVYLPATFVAGLFGTNFFNVDSDNGKPIWMVSNNFWLYWAITIPLTVATIIFWAIWHYGSRYPPIQKVIEWYARI